MRSPVRIRVTAPKESPENLVFSGLFLFFRTGHKGQGRTRRPTPTSPPEFISVKGNSQGISYTVQDTSDYMDIPDGGFFGRTEFITDSGSAVGTATEMKETFKFIKIGAEA